MRRVWIVAAVLVHGACLWVYTSAEWIIWDGSYQMTLRVSGPVRAVGYEPFGHREDAEFIVQHAGSPKNWDWAITVEPFTGEPLQVYVPMSGRASMSGRELDRVQFRYLAVAGQLEDGRWVAKVVDLPDCRESREVNVTLP